MYRPKNPAILATTENPLLRYSKAFIRNLPRRQKIVFFLKYIGYSLDIHNIDSAKEGLQHLCSLIPELKRDLAIANNTYLGEEEGERITMLFKHAFRKIAKIDTTTPYWVKKDRGNTKSLFS